MRKYVIELDSKNSKIEKGRYVKASGRVNGNEFSEIITEDYEGYNYGRISIGDCMIEKESNEIVEIASIYPDEVMNLFLEPIEIDIPILEDLGFVSIGSGNFINECGMLIKLNCTGDCGVYFINKNIHYVNELQELARVIYNKVLKL